MKHIDRPPTVTVRTVVQVDFLRGEGVLPDDPMRIVARYHSAEDGALLAEVDPFVPDAIRCDARSPLTGAWCDLAPRHLTTHFDGREHNWNDQK